MTMCKGQEDLSVEDWLEEIEDDIDYHVKRISLLQDRKAALMAFYGIKEDK